MKYTCMSFNILGCDDAGKDLYAPSEIRCECIARYLSEMKTDIVGIQEAGSHHRLYNWMENLSRRIDENGVYGVAKIDDDEEFMATTQTFEDKKVPLSVGLIILYKKDKFDLIERGAHRYSTDELQERYFQWVHLRDKENDRDIFVTNTHWSINWDKNGKVSPEWGAIYRTKQANELRSFWEEKVGNNILFATGDYNCRQDSDWALLAENGIYKQAVNVGDKDWNLGDHIDHIYINPDATSVEDLRFLDCTMDTSTVKGRHTGLYFWYSKDKVYEKLKFDRMSDHNPLFLTVNVK
ncbi:MAG: hypothetical protein IJT84_02475 [Clostridia bacterium]|nr:hypothetical protein [Clostridia bacterium]